jgi:hypothetical protein
MAICVRGASFAGMHTIMLASLPASGIVSRENSVSYEMERSRGSSVSIVTRLWAG